MLKNIFTKINGAALILMLFFVASISSPYKVSADNLVKDSDLDGLSDVLEQTEYKTDPFRADTDFDKYSDFIEVKYKTDPNDKNSYPSIDLSTIGVPSSKYFWLFARASGIAAFIFLTIGILYGMGMSTRSAYKIMRPPLAMEIHQTINVISLVAVIAHFTSLFFDNYFHLQLSEAFIPFLIKRPFTSELGLDFTYAIGFGIIAFYLIMLLVVTSLIRKKISIKLWRKIHYTSLLTYWIFVLHAITSGSDSKELWMQLIYGASVTLVTIMFLYRIYTMIKNKATKDALSKINNQTSTPNNTLSNLPNKQEKPNNGSTNTTN